MQSLGAVGKREEKKIDSLYKYLNKFRPHQIDLKP